MAIMPIRLLRHRSSASRKSLDLHKKIVLNRSILMFCLFDELRSQLWSSPLSSIQDESAAGQRRRRDEVDPRPD